MSRPKAEAPKIIEKDDAMGTKFAHPAYGMISCSRRQGGDQTLFGSELKHNHSIAINIMTATQNRECSTDWNFGRDQVVEVMLSEHQWSQFVSSMNTTGVPCTFRHKPKYPDVEWAPEILSDSKHEILTNELEDEGRRLTAGMEKIRQKMVAMEEGKTIKKTEFRELSKQLDRAISGVIRGMKFRVDQHKEVMEKNVHAAKSDVEGYVGDMVMKLGIESLKDIVPQLEDKTKDKTN